MFFVIVIYPEQATERKEWITQMTKLQESLDPAKRPVSEEQASIILDLATESYIQAIEASMAQLGYGSYIMGVPGSFFSHERYGNEPLVTHIEGHRFSIDPDSENLEVLTKKLFEKYMRVTKKQSLFIGQNVSMSLERSLRSARFATAGLSAFVYSNSNLSDYWEASFNNHYKEFSKALIKAHINQQEHGYNRDQFVDFLESAGAIIPESLLKIEEYDQPSQVMFNFKTDIKNDWKKLLEEPSNRKDLLDLFKESYSKRAK